MTTVGGAPPAILVIGEFPDSKPTTTESEVHETSAKSCSPTDYPDSDIAFSGQHRDVTSPRAAASEGRDLASSFSADVWRGVADQFQETRGSTGTPLLWKQLERLLQPSDGLAGSEIAALDHNPWGSLAQSDSSDRDTLGLNDFPGELTDIIVPVPLQFSDNNYRDDPDERLRGHLFAVLDRFDVWGVIASGSAASTARLRGIMRGIDSPFLVTTDSTSVPLDYVRTTELRLVPSNRAQARALLIRAASLAESYGRSAAIPFVVDPNDDALAYTTDLREQLQQEGARLDFRTEEVEPDKGKEIRRPLIVVGYRRFGLEIADARSVGVQTFTILSDGCAGIEVKKKPQRVWLARPAVSFSRLGARAFDALHKARQWIRTWDTANAPWIPATRDPSRHLRCESHTEFVRDYLMSQYANHFYFQSIENIRPPYTVEPLVE